MTMFTFYIIYLPDAVYYLLPFVDSLLDHSDCNFCLVSNHCTAEEKQALMERCQNDPRLSYLDLPTTKKPWQHGRALTYLYDCEREADYFCFMDSDIFATGPFMEEFSPRIKEHASVSSCSSLWATIADKTLPPYIKMMPGRYVQTADGRCLGSSYFAIYHRQKVDAIRARYGINFDKTKWVDLDEEVQCGLKRLDLQKVSYDTAKVLNLMLCAKGHTIHHQEADYLVHLGSVSALTVHHAFVKNKRRAKRILRFLPHSKLQFKLLCTAADSGLRRIDRQKLGAQTIAGVEQEHMNQHVRKSLVSRYFYLLLIALIDKQWKPFMPVLDNKQVEIEVRKATNELVFLFNQKS